MKKNRKFWCYFLIEFIRSMEKLESCLNWSYNKSYHSYSIYVWHKKIVIDVNYWDSKIFLNV